MTKPWNHALGMILFLAACSNATPPAPTRPQSTVTLSAPPPTATAVSTPSQTPLPPEPTATGVRQGPGAVTVPILLYHRIDTSPLESRYYVTPEKFEAQIKLLRDWGYTAIGVERLVQAITQGAELPPHPVIITFDDGHRDNYTAAFPIMQKYGYTGILYLVYNYIGKEGYMDVEEIKEMRRAGWEVGSHGLNHLDLKYLTPERQRDEIAISRALLEQLLGFPILTFAYPFGSMNDSAMDQARRAGYIAAMGANGYAASQGKGNLFYLQRVEIKGSEDAKTFIRFLPWHGDPSFLPTDTPAPATTPSRTPRP